jgi:hypothetical protein
MRILMPPQTIMLWRRPIAGHIVRAVMLGPLRWAQDQDIDKTHGEETVLAPGCFIRPAD